MGAVSPWNDTEQVRTVERRAKKPMDGRIAEERRRAGVTAGDVVQWKGHRGLVVRKANENNQWDVKIEHVAAGLLAVGSIRYDYVDGTYAVPEDELEVVFDCSSAADISAIADARESARLSESIDRAIAKLGDALDEDFTTKREGLVRLRRLWRRVQRIVDERTDVFEDLRSELDSLRRSVDASYRPAPRAEEEDSLDSTALLKLKGLVEVWQIEYDAKKSVFDAYVNLLLEHWKLVGQKPREDWRPSTSALDAAAFPIHKQASRKKRNEEELAVALLFDQLPMSKPREADQYLRLDPQTLDECRSRLLWWRVEWRNLRFCKCCYDSLPSSDFVVGESRAEPESCCEHVSAGTFCRDCLADYGRAALRDSAKLIGPRGLACIERSPSGSACEVGIQPAFFKAQGLLRDDEVDKLTRIVRSARIGDFGARAWCPRPSCDTVIDMTPGKEPKCEACHTRICRLCRQEEHPPGVACDSEHAQKDLQLVVGSNWQRCPSCCIIVAKTEACDHMTCRCSAKFCYNCGSPGHDCPVNCQRERHFNK